MSIRYAIADFISGGELTFQRRGWRRSQSINLDLQMKLKDALVVNSEYAYDLRKGVGQETDDANATVKSMDNIARSGLTKMTPEQAQEIASLIAVGYTAQALRDLGYAEAAIRAAMEANT